MDELTLLRKQARKYIDSADKKTLEIVYRILECSDEMSDPLASMSPEQEASFKRGVSDADEQRVTPNKKVMKQYSKWITK